MVLHCCQRGTAGVTGAHTPTSPARHLHCGPAAHRACARPHAEAFPRPVCNAGRCSQRQARLVQLLLARPAVGAPGAKLHTGPARGGWVSRAQVVGCCRNAAIAVRCSDGDGAGTRRPSHGGHVCCTARCSHPTGRRACYSGWWHVVWQLRLAQGITRGRRVGGGCRRAQVVDHHCEAMHAPRYFTTMHLGRRGGGGDGGPAVKVGGGRCRRWSMFVCYMYARGALQWRV